MRHSLIFRLSRCSWQVAALILSLCGGFGSASAQTPAVQVKREVIAMWDFNENQGGAGRFTGAGSSLRLGPKEKIRFTDDGFSIEMWINLEGEVAAPHWALGLFNNNQAFLRAEPVPPVEADRASTSPADRGLRLAFFVRTADGQLDPRALTRARLQPGAWHHVVATWDGRDARLYLDGALHDAAPHPGKISPDAIDPTLGGGEQREPNRNPFRGQIDDVTLHARALSAEEVAADYTAATDAEYTTRFAKSPGLAFSIDASPRPAGGRAFRMVDTVWAVGGWRDTPDYQPGWIVKREEGVITHVADWFGLSGHLAQGNDNWTTDSQGNIVFKAPPGLGQGLDNWALKGGVRPLVVMGTASIPPPLVEGPLKLGDYSYNIRQPRDYAKWRIYLESTFRWLATTYGRDEVARWPFLFGIEADWQAKAVYPGTTREMTPADNRREFIKMLDYFQAAAETVLGPDVNVGVYWAVEMQADDYIRHWAAETNYATGQKGTRIGFCGFSDWVNFDSGDSYNPWETFGRNRIHGLVDQYSYAPGIVRRYKYLNQLIERYPPPRELEITLPETGYIANPPQGGPNPIELVYADHRGAALYALRQIAYSECPRLAWAFNRYALGTGDQGYLFADEAKAPLFNAERIAQKMAGHRLLPLTVETTSATSTTAAATTEPTNDVRVMAVADAPATQGGPGTVRVLAVNWCDTLALDRTEKIILKINGFPASGEVELTSWAVDVQHNNWWPAWRAWRETHSITYVQRGTSGAKPPLRPEWLPHANDILATLRDEDRPRYLEWTRDNQKLMEFRPTLEGIRLPIKNGQVEFPYNLPGHGVLYLELRATRDGSATNH